MIKKLPIKYLFLLVFFTACATLEYETNKENNAVLSGINKETINVFLIGDAGKLGVNNTTPKALVALQEQFKEADANDILFFLGDNIYPLGLPSEKKKGYKAAKQNLDAQLKVAKSFPGSVYVIPGNHDWYHGIKGLKRQEKLVEEALGKNTFQPEDGCGIEKININDDTVLLLVDSQWYITDWDKQPTINDDCEIKTRDQFLEEFRSEIKKARGKTTLVAIHHPMFSNGSHAGQYTVKSNMSPLPVLGTIKNVLRTTSGASNADMSNWYYNDLRKKLIAAAQENNNVVFLSGHEHNLQFIQSDNLTQIISGSGSKITGVRKRDGNVFGASTNGFAVLNINKDKTSDVQFFDAATNKVIFRSKVNTEKGKSFINYPSQFPDSISASVYTLDETTKSGFYSWLWGARYRDYFSKPVLAKTVNLDTLYGGLKPVRKGGGTQSRSLRLEAKNGAQYVMRAVKKSATQYIQASLFDDQYVDDQFDETAAEALLKDVFTGSHPYAPLAIGELSDAAGVYHLNPKLYYIPKQNALMGYNNEFGNELYLLEEHASEGHPSLAGKNFTGDIVSTLDVIEEIHSDEDVVIDQENYVRARLFDMLIGDWDRHQDQWRWLEFKENGKKVYRALPRDRDQAFSKMSDGAILTAAINLLPAARILRQYDEDLKDVKGINVEPFPLDKTFIIDVDKSVWDAQVRYIQQHVTDDVIDKSFAEMPKEVQDESIDRIKYLLKSRRKNLQDISDRYYKVVNKLAIVTGTNKDDYFSIKAYKDGSVEVSTLRKKDDTIKDQFHHRVYNPKETKEIWIYGLDDTDTFEMFNKSRKIKIKLIGGQNNDEYIIPHGKNVVIYDYKSKKNTLDNVKSANIKLTDRYKTNVYNYKKFKNNTNQIIPVIGANPDDGLKIGVSNTYTTYGFERNPFTTQHHINAAYYFATNGYEVLYQGEFANVIGGLNFRLEAGFQSPNYSLNFFGYGNKTANNDDDLGLDYNRVKVRSVGIAPSMVWKSRRSSVTFGAYYESVEVNDTDNRFVQENNNILPSYVFDEVQFAGVKTSFSYSNYDNKAYPTVGLRFSMLAGYSANLDVNSRQYGYFIPALGIAHKLNHSGRLVLASNIKAHLNIGDDYEFYQAATIGGIDGLRGFRNQRFTGKTSFYQNTDLRYSFSNIKTPLIPIKLGLYGSFDYGRVWFTENEGSKWHNSYGGGMFINGAELISANLGVFDSVDGIRVAFGLGFGF